MNFAKQLEQYNTPPELYNGLPIQTMNTEDFIPLIRRELMKEAYEPNLDKFPEDSDDRKYAQDLNRQIEAAWINDTGTLFRYSDPVIPFGHGSPGHGKTTSFRVAAKQFAEAVGMNFVDRPNNEYRPSRKDFLYIQMEMAGEVSSITQGGLVVKGEDEHGREYMHKVPLRQLQMAQDAGFSLLVYDDVKNAGPSIQNILMAMMEERAFQGNKLGRMAVGATGNIGIDGTNISQSSTANLTRTQNFLVYDSVGNFVQRVLNRQQNEMYDGPDVGADAVLCFLMKNPELFTENVKKTGRSSVTGTHANPRTWSKCMGLMRELCSTYLQQKQILQADFNDPELQKILKRAADQIGIEKTADKLQELHEKLKLTAQSDIDKNPLNRRVEAKVKGVLGTNDAGLAFHEYMYRRLSYGTDLLASELMKNGELSASSQERFIKQYQGQSAEAKDFGHHMVMSMAEAASQPLAQAMRNNDMAEVKELSKRFTKGMLAPANIKIDGQNYNVALEDGEINRGVYFLLSKTTHALNDPNKLKASSTGYMMSPRFLESFLMGVAQEPTAAQQATTNSKQTRYDGIADLLTNTTQNSHIQVADLEQKIHQAKKSEATVTPEEAKEIAKQNEQVSTQTAPSQVQRTTADQSQVEKQEVEVSKAQELATSMSDGFDLDESFEPEPLELESTHSDQTDNHHLSQAKLPRDEDMPVNSFDESSEFDLDDDFEPPIPSRGMN